MILELAIQILRLINHLLAIVKQLLRRSCDCEKPTKPR